jgi:hypothetical protein
MLIEPFINYLNFNQKIIWNLWKELREEEEKKIIFFSLNKDQRKDFSAIYCTQTA